jgi:hypothetical protein
MATYKTPKPVATPVVGADDIKKALRDIDTSVANMHANVYKPTKTSGIETRGNGCATKGRIARGPMA